MKIFVFDSYKILQQTSVTDVKQLRQIVVFAMQLQQFYTELSRA